MLIRIMIFVVILACAGPFFIKGPDGKPLLTLDELFGDAGRSAVSATAPAGPVTVYKWQDENGIWQFSNEPVETEGVETMLLDGDINTMDPFSPPPESGDNGAASLPGPISSVNPAQVGNMMDTVNNLQQTVDQRKAEVDSSAQQP